MNIKEMIIKINLENYRHRLNGFEKIGGPGIIISTLKVTIARLLLGELDVNDKGNIFNEPYINHEVKTGRGGVQYISFNNGTMNYFPNGKYGPFTSRV